MNINKRILSILVVLMLILSGAVIYLQFNEKSTKDKKETHEEQIIDNRISPFQGQKLTVEVLRIRNRGLMDKMLQFGTSWRNPPSFYWVTEVDGEIGDSSHIFAAGGVAGEGIFTEWDTILKEGRMNYKINTEDQITSIVRISIMEKEKSALFGRNVEDVEKERIELVYDYRTGHWAGDDFILDKDGYGHYLGDEYEVWFNLYQSDYDHDGIPFWTEVNIYGTDPTVDDSTNDPDGDGIPSSWEWKWGYDPLRYDHHADLDPDVDGIENLEEYQMSKYFSDPYHQDIYIEADGMKKGGIFDWDHIFYKESQQMIIERYAQHNINVYIDDGWPDTPVNGGGEMLDFVETLDEVVGGHMLRWYKHNFPDERKGVFRYLIVANNAGFITPSTYNNYDHIVIDSSVRKTFFKRFAFTPRMQRVILAKAALHELGHSLGLAPWTYYGIDLVPGKNVRWPDTLTQEQYDKYLENYYSVMNYNYIWFPRDFFDYSDGSRDPVYDFDDWGHAYLPSFQTDTEAVEEPIDETFEDLEVLDKEPEPVYMDWIYDENLTKEYITEIEHYVVFDNAECNYRIYVNKNTGDVRGYVKPQVKPVLAIWSLVVEGKLKDDNKIIFYPYEDLSDKVEDLIS